MAAAILSVASFAQFKASPEGIVTEDGTGYIVVKYDGKTAEQLYKAIEAYIVANYVSPKNVMSGQEYTMINLRTLYKGAFNHKTWMGIKYYADVSLSVVFRIKDGKIRVDAPTVNYMWGANGNGEGELYYPDLFYKKNGSVRNEKRLENFNSWLNATTSIMLMRIDNEIKGTNAIKQDKDDW